MSVYTSPCHRQAGAEPAGQLSWGSLPLCVGTCRRAEGGAPWGPTLPPPGTQPKVMPPFLLLPRKWFVCVKLAARLGASREYLMAQGLWGCEADSYILYYSSPRIVTFKSFQDLIQPTSDASPPAQEVSCTPAVMGSPGPPVPSPSSQALSTGPL